MIGGQAGEDPIAGKGDVWPGCDRADAQALATELSPTGERAIGVGADVRNLASLRAAVEQAHERLSRISIVVAAAGVETMTTADLMSEEQFERDIDVNLTGIWRTYAATVDDLTKAHGYFLAVSSLAACAHSPMQSSYTASKAGVWALCDSIRLEMRHYGVGVGVAYPTFFDSPMLDGIRATGNADAVWGGNRRGIWKTVPRQQVVARIADGIQRRKRRIVLPSPYAVAAHFPLLAQAAVEHEASMRQARKRS